MKKNFALASLQVLSLATYVYLLTGASVGMTAPYQAQLGEEIDTYLTDLASPIAGDGDVFFAQGTTWNVDPRLVVAISGQEQGFGRLNTSCNAIFNAWSWFYEGRRCNTDPPASFDSWAQGIATVTKYLRKSYFDRYHAYTIPAIGEIYCAEDCGNWDGNVEHYYASDLGGDPGNLEFGSSAFARGDAVEVNGDNVNVRLTPNGNIAGQQSPGVVGTITGGPEWQSPSLYWWWQVDFESGADGWVAEQYLRKAKRTLTVSITGQGTGGVGSVPAGIQCPPDCDEQYAVDTSVDLTAGALQGHMFRGWSGDCSGTQLQTTVVMDRNKHCTVQFDPGVGGELLAPSASLGYSYTIYTVPANVQSATVTAVVTWSADWYPPPPNERTTSAPNVVEVPFNGGYGCDHVWKHPENNAVYLALDTADQSASNVGSITVGPGKTVAIAGSDCGFDDNFHGNHLVRWSVQLHP